MFCVSLCYFHLYPTDELQASRSEALGAPHIPQVRWSEVGGLEEAKRQIVNTIQLPLSHPSLVSSKLRRSGMFTVTVWARILKLIYITFV